MNMTINAMESSAANLNSQLTRIQNADWSRLLTLLQREGVSISRSKYLLDAYTKWLALRRVYGQQFIPPTDDVDQIWHSHILDTKHYCDFCNRIFGGYMHHAPEIEIRNNFKAKEKILTDRWLRHFNEPIPGKISVICR